MVEFFRILLNGIWEILNIQIPIDDGKYVTPWSIFAYFVILVLVIKLIRIRSERQE